MLAFQCPQCGISLAIPTGNADLAMVRCPQCRHRISLPKRKKSVSVKIDK